MLYSGGLSNFLYYVSLPDDLDTCNNLKSIKRARKDTSTQEPKEVSRILFCLAISICLIRKKNIDTWTTK